MVERLFLGREGEAHALRLLRAKGYRILGRNVRSKFGEIDVVAQQGKALCFVEIKARTGLEFGFPEEAVDGRKQWRLRRLALWYLQSRRVKNVPVRFDVVSVLLHSDGRLARIHLIPSAFEA